MATAVVSRSLYKSLLPSWFEDLRRVLLCGRESSMDSKAALAVANTPASDAALRRIFICKRFLRVSLSIVILVDDLNEILREMLL